MLANSTFPREEADQAHWNAFESDSNDTEKKQKKKKKGHGHR